MKDNEKKSQWEIVLKIVIGLAVLVAAGAGSYFVAKTLEANCIQKTYVVASVEVIMLLILLVAFWPYLPRPKLESIPTPQEPEEGSKDNA